MPAVRLRAGDRQARVAYLIARTATLVRNLKLTIEYEGTNYVGWQRQPAGVSIQALLEDALAPIEKRAVVVHGAGRTDAGVHALAQVASVEVALALDAETLQRALNAVLPADVRVLAIAEMPASFHARFSAISKTYEYRIVNAPYVSAFLHRYVWHVPQRLDVDAMREGASALAGRHDFAAFQAAGTPVESAERTIHEIAWSGGGGPHQPLVLRVRGDGFLRHMVRAIAGTLVDVGSGRWPASHVASILASRRRVSAGRSAPPPGLFLVEVGYPAEP
ncbi:MAG TPA: tRNA pseudouridine(38-40) synthase TruA [Vicinamibacterales bacterium]|nr:tRNA pseudouridine(38-40) synthase TruA [Vicinamibacterales bacterium]